MPELSRFYGIVIKMYFDDHDPSHFHAEYAEDEAVISIETLAVIAGRLRPRALGLVAEWAALRQEELRTAWLEAKNLKPIPKIDPLP
jgi:hypothetical protein